MTAVTHTKDTTMNATELKTTLAEHAKWTRDNATGTRANLSRADISRADLIGANLIGANLSGANLSRADLSRADLIGADLIGADLRDADLRDADLIGADLRGADLRGADLRDAYLSGANLRGADLRGADLRGADLRGADLRDADLGGANLSESTGVLFAACSWSDHGESGRQLLGAIIEGEFVLFCGCFRGSPAQLSDYITNDKEHDAIVERTRRIALAFVVERLTEMRDSRK